MPYPPEFDHEVVELYRSGLNMLQVAKRLRVSEQTVLEALRRRHEPRRQKGRPNRDRLIVDTCLQLQNIPATAEACGITPHYVYGVLRKNGICARTTAGIDRAKVVEMYASGLNTHVIGQRFGVDAGAIKRMLRADGVTLRPPGRRRPPVDLDALLAAYTAGVSYPDLRSRFGVSLDYIREEVRERAWPLGATSARPLRPRCWNDTPLGRASTRSPRRSV